MFQYYLYIALLSYLFGYGALASPQHIPANGSYFPPGIVLLTSGTVIDYSTHLEPEKGIEPPSSAYKAPAKPLSYTGNYPLTFIVKCKYII